MAGKPAVPARTFIEIRVHGVGDHDYLSALGRPRVRAVNSWVETAEAPELPAHRLRIVNWSRSNRRNTGFLWYLVFPFTLLNVAGRMQGNSLEPDGRPDGRPDARPGGRLLRWCVALVGLLLTASQLAWLVVLAETLLRYLPADGIGDAAGRAAVVAAALSLAAWLLYRWRGVIAGQSERMNRSGRRLMVAHGVLILAVGALVAWLRPAQLQYDGWPSATTPLPATALPEGLALTGPDRLDAMALWIAASTALAFLAALALTVQYWVSPAEVRRSRVPGVLAGGLMVSAVLLLHAVTALLRMVLDNVLGYVSGLFGATDTARTAGTEVLLAYDSPSEAGDSRLDLFPFLALIVVVAAALAAAVVLIASPGPGLKPLWGTAGERAAWLHSVVSNAPRLLPRVFPIAGLFALAGITAAVVLGEGRLGGPWLALAVLALHLAGGAVILVLLLGQLAPVREVLGKIADIAGFWPIRDHPLAGVSYRDAVVAGILKEVNRPDVDDVALVAHSQGSVICAWLVAGGRDGTGALPPKPYLVTAGSPLRTLYGAFFPAYFTSEFFDRVGAGARSGSWVNYWRSTDPIGTAVPRADNRRLDDPDPDGTVRGHSDYWSADELAEHLRSLRRRSFPHPPSPPVG